LNQDSKRNELENENRHFESKNYLEVPIDINLHNIQLHPDININNRNINHQSQNKENFNSLNINENIEQQLISSFISNLF